MGGELVVDSYVCVCVCLYIYMSHLQACNWCTSSIQTTKYWLAPRRSHHAHCQMYHIKVWFFNAMVTPTLMYNANYMGSNLHMNMWTRIEHHPLVTMLLEMMHGKLSTSHKIIWGDLASPPWKYIHLLLKANLIIWIWTIPHQIITCKRHSKHLSKWQ